MAAIADRITVLLLAIACAASAQCASHGAPGLLASGSAPGWALAWRGTSLSADRGALSDFEASARFHPGPGWDLGFRWSFSSLYLPGVLPGGWGAGLADPGLETGYRIRAGSWVLGAAGQLSAPLGHAGDGIGSDGFGAAAWLSAAYERAHLAAGLSTGLRGMTGAGNGADAHSHADPPERAYASAHPHADREWAYRAEAEWRPGPAAFSLGLDGAHVLGRSMGAEGSDFLLGEASLRFTLAGSSWKPSARFPLSPDRRLGFGAGLEMERPWPGLR